MEAASRPPLELLPDLPVEEPLDNAATPREPPVLPAAATGASAKSSAPAARDPEQTGLNFVDPEMFLAPGQESSAVQATTVATPKASEPLELVLEDPVVDDMLTAPSAAPAAAAPAPAPAAKSTAAPQAARSATPTAAERTAARVPIARTASLGAAATKLAAASAASKPKPAVLPLTRPAAAATIKPAAASNLASWAQARANASQTTAAAGARAAPASTSSPATTRAVPAAAAAGNARAAATPKAATPAPAAAGASTPATTAPAAATPPMDRDFIARNQVVERYLSGRLPLKGATDFERFCHDHPQLLDDIGLPERVNAGLRLLEASGKPEPWQESARPAWQKPQFTLALAIGVALLIVALVIVAAGSAAKNQRIIALQKQATERALDPATSTREIRLLPSRAGASNSPAIVIGGGAVQLADLRIDESRSPYHAFRVTIDRIDQGRVAIIGNLAKDSNGHLRLALNSSALGPGNYQLTLEGLDWRGDPQPDSWVTIGIAR
ncbi:MAG TPA: hypothetical protein VK800_12635 [Steroidobacteraceae bacterium]|jgi:hypothetical protein|nr:hypothetical protein [Steroidobacteraceae bacterium]